MKLKITTIILVILTIGCKKKDVTSWKSQIAGPAFYGSLGLAEILPDSILNIDSNNELSLIYASELLNFNLSDFTNLLDTVIYDTFSLPFSFPLTFNPGQQFINDPSSNFLEMDGAELKEISIAAGKIKYNLKSTIKGNVIYEYSIPGSTDENGQIFKKNVFVPAAGTSHSSVSGEFDLSGYTINLTGLNGNDINNFRSVVNVKVDENNGTAVQASNQDTIFLRNQISDIKIEHAHGYFGNHKIHDQRTNVITAFNKIVGGSFQLNMVNIWLEMYNGLGVDVKYKIQSISGDGTALNHPIIGVNQYLNRASNAYGSIIGSTQIIDLNSNNSNINTFIDSQIKSLSHDIAVEINPLENVSGHNDFAYSKYPLKTLIKAKIPLKLIANDLEIQDTIDLKEMNTDRIEDLSFNLEINNGFPFEAVVACQFLKDGFAGTNLLQNGFIPCAMTNNNTVYGKSTSTHQLTLSNQDLGDLKKEQKLIINIKFNTEGSTYTTIYDHYKIDFKLTSRLKYLVQI